RRAMQKVPLAKRPLLSVEDDDALSLQHQEVLLYGLGVVAAVRLPRPHDLDVHTDVRPPRALRLQIDERRPARVGERRRVGDVHDEGLVHRPTILAAGPHRARTGQRAPAVTARAGLGAAGAVLRLLRFTRYGGGPECGPRAIPSRGPTIGVKGSLGAVTRGMRKPERANRRS